MCGCTKPKNKKDTKDIVNVVITGIQNIPIPVKSIFVGLIPGDYRAGDTLLVITRKQSLDLPRKLADWLTIKYPNNFTYGG